MRSKVESHNALPKIKIYVDTPFIPDIIFLDCDMLIFPVSLNR
jgi:hypothetical protein